MRHFILEFCLLGAFFAVLTPLMPSPPLHDWQGVLLHAAGAAAAWLLLWAIYPHFLAGTRLRASAVYIGSGILYGVAVFAAMQAAAAFYTLLPAFPDPLPAADRSTLRLELTAPAMLLTGLREELFFRGWLQPRIQEISGSEWTAVAAAALLFGAAHLPLGLPATLFAATGGLLFSLMRRRHSSFLPAGIAHGVYNVLVVTLL